MEDKKLQEFQAHAPAAATRAETTKKSRWWLWLIVLGIAGYSAWRLLGTQTTAQTQVSAQSGSGRGRGGAGTVPVVAVKSVEGDLPVYYNGLGTVNAFNTVTVRSRVDGQLMRIAYQEGQFVHEGDLLAELDPRPFQVQLAQAEGQLAKDQAQLHDAEANFERYKLLYKEEVIPKQQLDSQKAQMDQFQGAIKSDQAQIDNAKLQLIYCKIIAPISGRIGLRLTDVGNMVHANDSTGILSIAQLQPVAVIFNLPQDQLPQVYPKLRAEAKLPVDAFDRSDTNKISTGTLLTIDNQIDSSTGTFKLKAVFENEGNQLFPNQFVNVHLHVDTRHELILVPVAAIQRGPQGSYVYVVGGDGTAHLRAVTVGLVQGNTAGLSDGLKADEKVVIDGQDKLQDGTKTESRTPTGDETQKKSKAS